MTSYQVNFDSAITPSRLTALQDIKSSSPKLNSSNRAEHEVTSALQTHNCTVPSSARATRVAGASAIVFDGLVVAKWSRSIFETMHAGGRLTAANCTISIWERRMAAELLAQPGFAGVLVGYGFVVLGTPHHGRILVMSGRAVDALVLQAAVVNPA